jgi:hypothetical protein
MRLPECTINLPDCSLWRAVERLAPLTGRDPVPEHKASRFRFEPDKFGAADLNPQRSDLVRPPRVRECSLQFEATIAGCYQLAEGGFCVEREWFASTPCRRSSSPVLTTLTLEPGSRCCTSFGITLREGTSSARRSVPRPNEGAVCAPSSRSVSGRIRRLAPRGSTSLRNPRAAGCASLRRGRDMPTTRSATWRPREGWYSSASSACRGLCHPGQPSRVSLRS